MPLVVGRAALVGDGLEVLGGDLTGRVKLRRWRARRQNSRPRRRELARLTAGEPDPGLGTASPASQRATRPRRPLASPRPAADLLVGAAAARRDRDPDLGEHLARADHGLVGARCGTRADTVRLPSGRG